MFSSSKKLGKAIAARFRKNDPVPAATPDFLSLAPALPLNSSAGNAVSARIERRAQVFTVGISDNVQLNLVGVQGITGPIPFTPLQAAIGGLLTILQTIDRHAQNKAAIASVRRRLYRLSRYLGNAPSPHDGSEQSRIDELISLLQDTSDQLVELDNGGLVYQSVTQALAGFSTELDHYLAEYAFAVQMNTQSHVVKIRETVTHYLTLVDGAGYEHRIPLEFCTSFQQFNKIIEILFTRDSTEARTQALYVQQGQYDLYIDGGTRVDPDEWQMFEGGTRILMKFLEPLCELPEDLSQLLNKTSGDPVAQGSFGDVWKCSLSYTSGITLNLKMVYVAVKVFRISPDDQNGMKDIRREMGIWKRLRHGHIVPFFGIADAFVLSRISLVSSWQENGTLTYLLNHNCDISHRERLLLLGDIASGLSYLHSEKVVHGDLTGSNVLIDADGRARLTDFGLSSVVDASEGLTYLALTARRPGAIRWVAPELCTGEDDPPTFWSDIYSYGCVMLQTLSGRLPWSEIKSDHNIIVKLSQRCHPLRPNSLPILDAHWDFIMRCLNLDGSSRPSATEVLEWIRAKIRHQEPRNDRS